MRYGHIQDVNYYLHVQCISMGQYIVMNESSLGHPVPPAVAALPRRSTSWADV